MIARANLTSGFLTGRPRRTDASPAGHHSSNGELDCTVEALAINSDLNYADAAAACRVFRTHADRRNHATVKVTGSATPTCEPLSLRPVGEFDRNTCRFPETPKKPPISRNGRP